MPIGILMNVITYFQSKERYDLISYLIINLNLKNQENGPLIKFCLKNMLFKAFVYTCNMGNNDFLTPIISFFN